MKIKQLTPIERRQIKIRATVKGTAERPRLSVSRSNIHILAQAIDDVAGKTVAAVSDFKLKGDKTARAIEVGKSIGAALKAKGIMAIAFDRRGRKYHGRIKAVADAIRETGIVF